MNTNIWNSSQMAGTGGALKALAKNLASKLKLNRTDMKRVVARVISERHGQGDVGDYNGHMFFVKPDRIDMTKQITHAKDAFDEMFKKKTSSPDNSKGQLRSPRSMSEARINTYHMPGRLKLTKSLNGIKINRQHLKRRGNANEIVVQMPTALLRSRSRLGFKRFLNAQTSNQAKRQLQAKLKAKLNAKPSLRSNTKMKSLHKVSTPSRPKLLAKAKAVLKPSDKLINNKLMKLAQRPQRRQIMEPLISRLPAGHAIAKAVLNAYQEDTPLTHVRCKRKPSTALAITRSAPEQQKKTGRLAKKPIASKKTPEKKDKRMSAGGKPSRNLLAQKTQKTRHWHNPYQFPGGAGATHQPNARPSAIILKPSRSALKNKQMKQIKQTFAIRTTRSKRLAKQLKDDEPIDDPQRLYAGSVRPVKRPKRRPYKMSSRLIELAKPSIHRCVFPEIVHSHSLLQPRDSNQKLKTRHRSRRVLLDSSQGSLVGARDISGSGLTPAKRHLTLAFLKKDAARSSRSPRSPHSPRSPRSARTALWK